MACTFQILKMSRENWSFDDRKKFDFDVYSKKPVNTKCK